MNPMMINLSVSAWKVDVGLKIHGVGLNVGGVGLNFSGFGLKSCTIGLRSRGSAWINSLGFNIMELGLTTPPHSTTRLTGVCLHQARRTIISVTFRGMCHSETERFGCRADKKIIDGLKGVHTVPL